MYNYMQFMQNGNMHCIVEERIQEYKSKWHNYILRTGASIYYSYSYANFM
jgi:hypothetical protein